MCSSPVNLCQFTFQAQPMTLTGLRKLRRVEGKATEAISSGMWLENKEKRPLWPGILAAVVWGVRRLLTDSKGGALTAGAWDLTNTQTLDATTTLKTEARGEVHQTVGATPRPVTARLSHFDIPQSAEKLKWRADLHSSLREKTHYLHSGITVKIYLT